MENRPSISPRSLPSFLSLSLIPKDSIEFDPFRLASSSADPGAGAAASGSGWLLVDSAWWWQCVVRCSAAICSEQGRRWDLVAKAGHCDTVRFLFCNLHIDVFLLTVA
ncbi:unnamed protein product [Urochloa humidicola]